MESDGVILVVDDEQVLRESIIGLLSQNGFVAVGASSGRDALSVLEDLHIDIVLSDIQMPDGDGMFLLKNIRAQYGDEVRVILMTANSPYSDNECMEKGAYCVLHKPFNLPTFLNTIRRATQRNRVSIVA